MVKEMYQFSADGNSCIITDPKPPRFWYNYLWNESGYCAQISQIGHGRSYFIDEKANMCRVNRDDARYIYLRDEESGHAWNVGFGPLNATVEDYYCNHHIAYSELGSRCEGIRASWRIIVPQNGTHEIWILTLTNESKSPRTISSFAAVDFSLEGFSYPRYYEMYRCMETNYEKKMNGIYCSSRHPFAPHARYNAFLIASETPCAYDGELSRFCGPENTKTEADASASALFQRPDVVTNGQDCTNSEGSLFILGAVLQHKLTLAPGEEKQLRFSYGVVSNSSEAENLAGKLADAKEIKAVFEQTRSAILQKYQSLLADTPDTSINTRMNNWVKKQADFCIVGKKGVRDNLQIAVALLSYRPEKAQAEILECMAHQFRDGHAVLTWYPYDDTRYSDQPFWIIWAGCALIRETGNFLLLHKLIPWQDGGEASMLEHMRAAARCLIRDKGPNGLIRIRFADWNDALNITTDPDAESVMLSEQACLALREFAALMTKAGRKKPAIQLMLECETLKAAINSAAWDGAWYMRAISKDGNIGSRHSAGSKIYINAQTWAVLADIADDKKLPKLLESVDSMEHDFGFPLNLPPYEEYSPQVGRMSGMLPGLFENGGVYCHATGFKLLMDCKLKRSAEALRTLKKIMPDSPVNPVRQSGAEPYVFTNCYSTHPKYYGRSYQSWTTGTSAWALRGFYEGILGVRADFDGLRLEPCFPAEWDSAEMTRAFRGAEYHIIILNPDHLSAGTPAIAVDGICLDSQIIPDFRDGKRHEITAILH